MLTLIIATFTALSFLLVKDESYEGGTYLNYAKSIVADQDLNIINQVPKHMSWLSTDQYFHPHFHSELQTGTILIFYSFSEGINKVFSIFTPMKSNFFYITFLQNIFLLLLGFIHS